MAQYTKYTGPSSGNRLGVAADELLGRRIAGRDPGLNARFAMADEATRQSVANANATNAATLARGGGAFSPAMRRNVQAGQYQGAQAVSQNMLGQASQSAQAQDSAMQMGMARGQQDADRQMGYLKLANENAQAMGDATTSSALQGIYMGGAGQEYTDAGRASQAQDAQRAAEEEAWAKRYMESQNVKGNEEPAWKRGLKGVLGGAAAGSAFGPIGSGVGAGAGALLSLF